MCPSRFVQVIRFIFLLTLGLIVDGYKDGLYSTETDFVKPLNHETFQAEVINSRPGLIWIVEFYNSWCGHCIHFAPTWKQLAKDLKDLVDIVVVAAIDCSQSVNVKPCRQFDIQAYPTVKMFPPSEMSERLEKVAVVRSQDIQKIKHNILNFVTDFTPSTWPRLKPLEKMEDLWQEKGIQNAQLFVIFEEEKSLTGRQVVLDLRNVSGVLVRTMVKEKVTKYGITEFPSLYKINPDSTYTKLAVGKNLLETDRLMFVEHIREEVKTDHANSLKVISERRQGDFGVKNRPANSVHQINPKVHVLQPNGTKVNMQDLESALHYSLRQEIAICQTMDGERLDTLKSYIVVLKKYFPGREPVQKFLVKVSEMLSSLPKPSLTGEEWMDQLDSLQTKEHYLPEVIRWVSCQGSSLQYRGFPCSMWTLFHVLTVAAYTQNRGQRASNPKEVLSAMQGYMKHFFGCEECSKHFLEMSQNINLEVTSQAESVLWLWRSHNRVNKRLHGDESEDPQFPKVQFPPKSLCNTCRDDRSFKFREKNVLPFLIEFYSEKEIFISDDLETFHEENPEINVVGDMRADSKNQLDWWEKKQRDKDLKQIQELRLRKRNRKTALEQSQPVAVHHTDNGADVKEKARALKRGMRGLWGLTQLDVSMCVVFYIISTAIILLLYYHFIIRRRMNPCKNVKTVM
ncbi:sulfhydryl oxidase [Plakobranchus ocellatus]|uniref:Sulfhydryl oxidase n=1 Tax=Plakobranchus ocellatus TaxID=259542 RepID=A0AAV3Z187_9GAST|nr:sulfhydryl oxidase [Plakobranchus ocellatus]